MLCRLDLNTLQMPRTSANLVIETAGGLFSPFNANATMLDLILRWPGNVILVSKHYVGSINHTLLTIEALEKFGIELTGIIYSDVENTSTESFIAQHKPGYPSLRTGIVDESKIEEVDRKASEMQSTLIEWLQ
jgi:dethiobiotin synthetase